MWLKMYVRWSQHWWFEILIRIFVKIEVHEHWSQDSDTLLVSCSPKTNSGAIFRGRKNILEELLSFIRANQTVLDNRKELGDLKANLEAILSIVKQYQKQNSLHALRNRIELFCTSVAFSCFLFGHVYIHWSFAALSPHNWSRSRACRSIHCRPV